MTLYTCKDLKARYHDFKPGDIVLGEMASAHKNTVFLVDLLQRGVKVIPSPLAQLLSRSKVAQVDILGHYMHPLTMAIKRRKDLLAAIGTYAAAGIGPVVTKEEHMHCGHGVRRWENIEALYSYRGLDKEGYPFVLQPLVKDFIDVRAVMVGDYFDAYTRCNPDNFRGNLSLEGACAPYDLAPRHIRLCRDIAARTQFPYAHLDLQVLPDGQCYIFEIALNGGIQGSQMDRADLEKRKTSRLHELARQTSAI